MIKRINKEKLNSYLKFYSKGFREKIMNFYLLNQN